MKNFKKAALMCVAMVLVAALAIAGTVAYLTDTDSKVNVMTVGSVKIEQNEYERVIENGAYKVENGSYVLKDFTQGKPLYPATEIDANGNPYNNGAGDWDTTTVDMSQVGSQGSQKVFTSKNAQDKIVTVKTTGKSDAYVRTWIALEDPFTENRIGVNVGKKDYYTQTSWTTVEIDGVKYSVSCFTYKEALKPGEVSTPSLFQVYLNSKATNEDMELLGDTYEILAFSQAVQPNGFDSADAALNTAFGANHPWADGVSIPIVVDTADELVAALESGKDVILTDDVKINPAGMSNSYGTTGINVKNGQTIDGNGNILDIKGAGGTWDSGINTTGGLIKNITVTGSFRGIFINHNSTHSAPVILENVIINGTTYTISCDQGMYQNFEAYNSTFNGWTSYAATLGTAKFENCKFGRGNGYAYCRPYAPTTFVGCDFEAGYTLDPRAAVTLENCTLNGVALTAANIADLVVDTTKATVK